MKNSNELLTMEEKKKLNPKEIMENGLTREQNEKIEQNASALSGGLGIISIVLAFYSLYMLTQI